MVSLFLSLSQVRFSLDDTVAKRIQVMTHRY